LFYSLACDPAITEIVHKLIGENIMLWGATLVNSPPGFQHPWHSDIETAYAKAPTVSVWLVLKHANRNTALRLMSFSHLIGASVQEMQLLHSVDRSALASADVLAWARERNPDSRIFQPDMRDGDAIFFDGRTWHGSHNTNSFGRRVAVLLQYATPEVPIHIWRSEASPWQYADRPRPPCIMIRGSDTHGYNNIVSMQSKGGETMGVMNGKMPFVASVVRHVELPLEENRDGGWQPYPICRGVTPSLDSMSFHISVLSPDVIPHEPHVHPDEELLIMLSGEADLVMVPENVTGVEKRYRLAEGSLVYYPAFYRHTIHNTGNTPITYLMFKWRSPVPSGNESPAAVFQFDHQDLSKENRHEGPFDVRHLFSFPTRHLRKLQCHVSLLQPGAGYSPHRDDYDVAILLLQGVVETLGTRLEPFGVIYYSAGVPHGIRNIGTTPAYYLVFEFHPGPRRRWLRIGLQLRRVLKSPITKLPRNIGVLIARESRLALRVIYNRLFSRL
jgi:mannose-6-phosphate isomerase-like protein (cupin superfamily)